MPKLAANLTMMFTEVPFLERFGAAARAGFAGVEFLSPYAFAAEEVAAALRDARVAPVLFNAALGDWERGERGLAALPGRERDFDDAFAQGVAYARALGCPRLHVMSGNVEPGADLEAMRNTFVANVRRAAGAASAHGIELSIEPLNPRDMPRYFIHTTGEALALIERVARANVSLQLDLYHVQVCEGDLAHHVRALQGRYGHVQIAGNPGRHEPDDGEVNYPFLFALFDEIGYGGWVACEYHPRAGTLAGLGWARPYGIGG